MQGVSCRKQTINPSALFSLQFHTVFDSHIAVSFFWPKIWIQAPCSAAAVSSCSERPLGCAHTAPTCGTAGTSPISPWSWQAAFPGISHSPPWPHSLPPMACWVPGKSKCELVFPSLCRRTCSWLVLQLLYCQLCVLVCRVSAWEHVTVWGVGWDGCEFITCAQTGS